MGDWRDQGQTSRCDFARGGVHAAARDEPAGEAGIFAVVYLFHLAQHEGGAYQIFYGAHGNGSARVFSTQSVAEYSGHFAGIFAARRTAGIYGAADSGGHAGFELWNLWARVRVMRKRSDRERQRGVFKFGKVRAKAPRY